MTEYTENFERFWQAYPKRNGRKVGKKPASNQWGKLTADEKRAAFADVEKRNRQQGWGKYIRDAQRYLRDHGWEDEWEPAQSDMYSRRPVEAKAPEIKLHWCDQMMNRLFINFLLACRGVRDVQFALDIKHRILDVDVPALEEDVAAEKMSKQEMAEQIADTFLTRLDIKYGKATKNRVLAASRKAA